MASIASIYRRYHSAKPCKVLSAAKIPWSLWCSGGLWTPFVLFVLLSDSLDSLDLELGARWVSDFLPITCLRDNSDWLSSTVFSTTSTTCVRPCATVCDIGLRWRNLHNLVVELQLLAELLARRMRVWVCLGSICCVMKIHEMPSDRPICFTVTTCDDYDYEKYKTPRCSYDDLLFSSSWWPC